MRFRVNRVKVSAHIIGGVVDLEYGDAVDSDGHGFIDPHGFTGTGLRGTGAGGNISTRQKPVPSQGLSGSDGGFDL